MNTALPHYPPENIIKRLILDVFVYHALISPLCLIIYLATSLMPFVCVCGQFLLMTMSLLCYFEDASGFLDERFNQGAVLMLTCIGFKEITTSYVPKTSHLNYIVSIACDSYFVTMLCCEMKIK